MTRFRRVAVMGTGTMGPGMGGVLARAGMEVALFDTSPEALERAKSGYDLAWGVLDRLETPVVEGGSVRYASDVADALQYVCLAVNSGLAQFIAKRIRPRPVRRPPPPVSAKGWT